MNYIKALTKIVFLQLKLFTFHRAEQWNQESIPPPGCNHIQNGKKRGLSSVQFLKFHHHSLPETSGA